MERRLAAILMSDVVGCSRLIGLDEEGTIARQKAHRDEILDPTISMHGGRVVKATGDVGAKGAAVTLIAMAVPLDTRYRVRASPVPFSQNGSKPWNVG